MGGEAKQEEAKAEPKPEEKKEEKQEEKKEEKVEEKKEEEKLSPPQPTVLFVDLHCVGCAKKIERSILKCKGVEEVVVDMVQNQVTVKGIVDPQTLCSTIQKKTTRNAKVLSPLPPAEGETTTPEAVASQVVGVATVELHVNMHCEACAQQLRRKILKMRGVQSVETEQAAKRVVVTGTMTPDRLLEYIHRRTGKLAKVIPPPPPPPPPKEEEKKEKEAAEKKSEEKPPEENKEEKKKKEEEAPKEDKDNADSGKDGKGGGEERKVEVIGISEEDMMAKKLAYLYGGGMINYGPSVTNQEEMGRMMVQWMPIYVVEPPRPPPPPQLFSDENPNACSIS